MPNPLLRSLVSFSLVSFSLVVLVDCGGAASPPPPPERSAPDAAPIVVAPVDAGPVIVVAPPPAASAPAASAPPPRDAGPPLPAATTPEQALTRLVSVMQSGPESELTRFATEDGLASLRQFASDEADLRRMATAWDPPSARWQKKGAKEAEALVGPKIKAALLVFVKTKDGWKLRQFGPGA